jgi:hypothetical protein
MFKTFLQKPSTASRNKRNQQKNNGKQKRP